LKRLSLGTLVLIAIAIAIACNSTNDPAPRPVDATTPTPVPEAGAARECTAPSDCAAQKCCAEVSDGKLVTHCRASCITNVPRTQTCKTTADCTEGGGPCKDWSCAGVDAQGLMTCASIGCN
jgi:hypothetical protein